MDSKRPPFPESDEVVSEIFQGIDATAGQDVSFEPKWDGFRCIVFRDDEEVILASRNERPFTRYFPELIEPLKASLPLQCVIDGEIVIASADGDGLGGTDLRGHRAPTDVRVWPQWVETFRGPRSDARLLEPPP